MSQNEAVYRLTSQEFFFLTEMLGLQGVAGFEDPFRGYLVDEIEEQFDQIRPGLISKGYLIPGNDSAEYEIEDILGICIAVCGASDAVQVKKFIAGSGSYDAFLYFMPNLVVEMTVDEEGSIVLSPVANAEISFEWLFRFFPLTLRSERQCELQLNECSWSKWSALTSKERTALLEEKECPEEELQPLVAAFENAERSGSMVFWNRQEYKWYTESYHYVQNEQELYLVSEISNEDINIQAYNPEVILDGLNRFGANFDLGVEVEGGG